MARLRERFERLSRPPEEVRAENLAHWISTIPDVTPLDAIEARKRVKVAGVIQNIRIDPRSGSGSVEATIIDGSGSMVVRWLGRSSMRGVRLGAGLIVEGVAGKTAEGESLMLNPEYDLVPDPEHG
ncbi:MAG TPA: hypothetical protein VM573_05930 [Actinomycetota bacterium]|nr:hypothetical protein [Actinomycetota bacterium]